MFSNWLSLPIPMHSGCVKSSDLYLICMHSRKNYSDLSRTLSFSADFVFGSGKSSVWVQPWEKRWLQTLARCSMCLSVIGFWCECISVWMIWVWLWMYWRCLISEGWTTASSRWRGSQRDKLGLVWHVERSIQEQTYLHFYQMKISKHRKNCECCPVSQLIVR